MARPWVACSPCPRVPGWRRGPPWAAPPLATRMVVLRMGGGGAGLSRFPCMRVTSACQSVVTHCICTHAYQQLAAAGGPERPSSFFPPSHPGVSLSLFFCLSCDGGVFRGPSPLRAKHRRARCTRFPPPFSEGPPWPGDERGLGGLVRPWVACSPCPRVPGWRRGPPWAAPPPGDLSGGVLRGVGRCWSFPTSHTLVCSA